MIRLKLINNKIKNAETINIKLASNYKSNIFGFKARKNEVVFINNEIILGINKARSEEDWRRIGFNLGNYINKELPNSSKFLFSTPINENKSQSFFEGILLSNYKFNTFKTNKKKIVEKIIYFNIDKKISKKSIMNNILKSAKRKTNGQFITRDLINTPPNYANSSTILEETLKIFKDSKVDVSFYQDTDLEKLNMNGHLAVNQASKERAITIKLEITPKNYKKHLVFVGKGLTYDTGGLSLKPSNHMTTMKSDKAGAITLLGMMYSLKHNKENKNKITCYLALAENAIGFDAYKPDDILVMKNGKTVHVKNTDAEGRIVLFDNLCLAQEENNKIDELFSVATLTGAAVYQFGDEAAGIVGHNKKIKNKIIKTGKNEGEIFCNAELHEYVIEGTKKDDIADIDNLGESYKNMGCQKGAIFLMESITKKNINKYTHLDIAGPAFVNKPFGTNPSGATGFAVRTLTEYCLK